MPVDPTIRPRLRSMGAGARLGLTALIAVLFIGLVASGAHLYLHHQNRDEEPGLSMIDLKGAYHGVQVPSRLRVALAEGHPQGLPAAARDALAKWLAKDADAISREYDNLDLGDLAPSELIAANCLTCHDRANAVGKGGGLALDSWESVKRVAISKDISPAPIPILVASTHAHALTLATLGVVVAMLLWFTRWPRGVASVLVFAMGVGLLFDIGGWWAARSFESAVYAIAIGGAAFNLALAIGLLLVLAELWLPGRAGGSGDVTTRGS
ncbi:MAG: hypothetical protein U0575_01220 [Phycisphaerales bacterium]